MRSNIAINSYLRQQQSLFGNELYISKRDTKDSGESISYNKLVSEEDCRMIKPFKHSGLNVILLSLNKFNHNSDAHWLAAAGSE